MQSDTFCEGARPRSALHNWPRRRQDNQNPPRSWAARAGPSAKAIGRTATARRDGTPDGCDRRPVRRSAGPRGAAVLHRFACGRPDPNPSAQETARTVGCRARAPKRFPTCFPRSCASPASAADGPDATASLASGASTATEADRLPRRTDGRLPSQGCPALRRRFSISARRHKRRACPDRFQKFFETSLISKLERDSGGVVCKKT